VSNCLTPRCKVGNVRTVFNRYAKRAGVERSRHPNKDEVNTVLRFAAKQGVFVASDGRAYVRYQQPVTGHRQR
jgi:hypothetical protein